MRSVSICTLATAVCITLNLYTPQNGVIFAVAMHPRTDVKEGDEKKKIELIEKKEDYDSDGNEGDGNSQGNISEYDGMSESKSHNESGSDINMESAKAKTTAETTLTVAEEKSEPETKNESVTTSGDKDTNWNVVTVGTDTTRNEATVSLLDNENKTDDAPNELTKKQEQQSQDFLNRSFKLIDEAKNISDNVGLVPKETTYNDAREAITNFEELLKDSKDLLEMGKIDEFREVEKAATFKVKQLENLLKDEYPNKNAAAERTSMTAEGDNASQEPKERQMEEEENSNSRKVKEEPQVEEAILAKEQVIDNEVDTDSISGKHSKRIAGSKRKYVDSDSEGPDDEILPSTSTKIITSQKGENSGKSGKKSAIGPKGSKNQKKADSINEENYDSQSECSSIREFGSDYRSGDETDESYVPDEEQKIKEEASDAEDVYESDAENVPATEKSTHTKKETGAEYIKSTLKVEPITDESDNENIISDEVQSAKARFDIDCNVSANAILNKRRRTTTKTKPKYVVPDTDDSDAEDSDCEEKKITQENKRLGAYEKEEDFVIEAPKSKRRRVVRNSESDAGSDIADNDGEEKEKHKRKRSRVRKTSAERDESLKKRRSRNTEMAKEKESVVRAGAKEHIVTEDSVLSAACKYVKSFMGRGGSTTESLPAILRNERKRSVHLTITPGKPINMSPLKPRAQATGTKRSSNDVLKILLTKRPIDRSIIKEFVLPGELSKNIPSNENVRTAIQDVSDILEAKKYAPKNKEAQLDFVHNIYKVLKNFSKNEFGETSNDVTAIAQACNVMANSYMHAVIGGTKMTANRIAKLSEALNSNDVHEHFCTFATGIVGAQEKDITSTYSSEKLKFSDCMETLKKSSLMNL